jgi:carboxyl-terminal processing protease
MYFKFASRYIGTHKEEPSSIDEPQLAGSFQSYLDEQKFTYQDDGEAKVKELSDVADKSKYSPAVKELINHLKTELEKEKSNGMERNKAEVMRALTMEVVSRYKGERGRIGASLAGDVQLQTARKLLADGKEYERRLSVK